MMAGAVTISESSIGNEISQRLGGVLTSLVELQQLGKDERLPECGSQNSWPAEAAVGIAHPVEIERQIFSRGVGDDADAIEGQVVLFGFLRHCRGFHFDGGGARLAKLGLFRSGTGDAVNGK